MRWVEPDFVNEGQEVVAPYPEAGPRAGLRCRVVTACGDAALVENKARGFRRWFPLYDLRIEAP